jgi:hypothetical protein
MVYLIIRNGAEPRSGTQDWSCIHKDRQQAYNAFSLLKPGPDEFAQLVEIDSIQGTWKPLMNVWGPDAANDAVKHLFDRIALDKTLQN